MREGAGGRAEADTAAAAATVARRSYGKLIAILAARSRDVAGADDALADAFAAALAGWPLNGVPRNPEAWLLTAARRKLIDAARRQRSGEAAGEQLAVLGNLLADAGEAATLPDRRLGLLFACTHPAIDEAARAPLMLQAVLGLDAATIAGAFLASPAAMGKRLVRAKETIRQAGIPFRVPEADELAGRLDFVLDAIYATFAEGWADPAGTEVQRRDLTDEALYLARLLAALLPQGGRGARPARPAAACRSAPPGAPHRRRRLCPPGTAGRGAVESGADRRSRGAAAPRRCAAKHRPLPARSGAAIGTCRPRAPWIGELGRGGPALRCPAAADRLAGGAAQPRAGGGGA